MLKWSRMNEGKEHDMTTFISPAHMDFAGYVKLRTENYALVPRHFAFGQRF